MESPGILRGKGVCPQLMAAAGLKCVDQFRAVLEGPV